MNPDHLRELGVSGFYAPRLPEQSGRRYRADLARPYSLVWTRTRGDFDGAPVWRVEARINAAGDAVGYVSAFVVCLPEMNDLHDTYDHDSDLYDHVLPALWLHRNRWWFATVAHVAAIEIRHDHRGRGLGPKALLALLRLVAPPSVEPVTVATLHPRPMQFRITDEAVASPEFRSSQRRLAAYYRRSLNATWMPRQRGDENPRHLMFEVGTQP